MGLSFDRLKPLTHPLTRMVLTHFAAHFENPKRLNYKHCTPNGAQEIKNSSVCGTDFNL
jgi:hypothetical protein